MTRAGDREEEMKSVMSELHSMISIFSPLSSVMTDWTRVPRWPTQAPTASILLSWLVTAILVRDPASRAILTISTMPAPISGTSCSKRRRTRPGWLRETMMTGRWSRWSTFKM